MNRLKIYTTRLQTKNIPLKTQTLLESKNNAKDSSSGYGRHKLNIVTQDIIDEYLNKMDLDMSNDNDNEVRIFLILLRIILIF